MATTYYQSPFGVARFPWITRADSKYHADNPLYHVDLVMDPSPQVDAFVEFVTAAAQKGFDEETEAMTPKDRKAYKLYIPVVKEEDDQGNETGRWVAKFKQNSIIKRKDGTLIDVKIGVKDAKLNDITKPVFGGSVLRVMYSTRNSKMTSSKEAGCRLDFASVQVTKLQAPEARGFDAVEGYEDDGSDPREQKNFDPAEGHEY
jgi:hypothetical protein